MRRALATLMLGSSVVVMPAMLAAETAAGLEASQGALAPLARTAPETIAGDAPQTTVSVDREGPQSNLREDRDTDGPHIVVTTKPESSDAASIAFTVDDAASGYSTRNGVTAFATSSAGVSRFVAEAGNGARVLTTYSTPQPDYVSRTTFDFSHGEHPRQNSRGDWYIESGDDRLGAILAPWSRDAAGRVLATRYEWQDSTLIQTVDVPDSARFPIVADPAWTYTWTASVKVGSPQDVHDKMHDCFNCIFPVEGAPRSWPHSGQVLPLVVRPFSGLPSVPFTCIFGETTYFTPNPLYPGGEFGFWFEAAAGHVDGVGSRISFDWWTGADRPEPNEKMRLTVYGDIVNEHPATLPRPVYLAGAKGTWTQFLIHYVDAFGHGRQPFFHWVN